MGESASGSKPKPNSNSTEPVYAKDEAYLQSIIPKRIMLFELLQSEQRLKRTALPDELIRITLPDGKVKEGKKSKISPLDVAKEISKSLASNALIAKVNGVLWDMSRPLEEDCKLELYTFETEEGRDTFWHSSAHILGESLEQTYGCRLCIGPCTTRGEGFHYDAFYGDLELNEDHFKQIEAAAKKAIDEKQPFDRIEVTRHQALYMFSDNPFKVEIIKDLPEDKTITVYRCGPLVDLCRGPHIPNTSFVKAFSCLKASSAYWRGNKDRESLQRVYGISFPDQEHLKIWAYEAIPVLGRQCVRLINEDSMPRMTKWVYHQTQDTDWVSFFASEMQPLPHATLTPTPKEQQTAYWISVTGENSLQVSFPMPVPVQPRPEHSVSFPTPVPVQSRSALADEPSQAARPQRSKRAASRECLTIDHSFPDIQMGPSTDGQEVPTADEEHPRRAKEARLDDEGISRQNRSIPHREYEIMLTMLEERWEKREQTFFRREEDMLKKVNEHWDKREKQFFSKVGDMFKKVFGRGM